MTPNKSNLQHDGQLRIPSAEEAGAAACRAGVLRDAVPSSCSLEHAGTGGEDGKVWEERWCLGWDRAKVLQEVSDRMFPGSVSGQEGMVWKAP